ncbi:MAG: protein phosphatase 2C domain-containing protein [Pseudomonadota bacterium]|nr:protein phosphatase 2C domain-containing protein [Pseudomonadota bacterium]
MALRTPPLAWTSAACTHVGAVRKVNEDAFLDQPQRGLWAVADGMGGHQAGDVASRMIVEGLERLPEAGDCGALAQDVTRRLQDVNRRLRAEAARRYQHRTIGSTVAILLAHGDRGVCLWVGDSRVYRLRAGELRQLTRDHSHVQELLEQGLIQPHQARNHPMGNIITRAVGAAEQLEVDRIDLTLQPGDLFLLCTDGLNRAVTDGEIARCLSRGADAARELLDLALVRGVNDNVTVIVVGIAAGRGG